MADKLTLCADFGGTRSRFGMARAGQLLVDTVVLRPNDTLASPRDALVDYLSSTAMRPDAALLAIAGPVTGRQARLTNRDWDVDADGLDRALGFGPVRLINDLAATAFGIDTAPRSTRVNWSSGRAQPDAPVLVVGIGTGMNTALLDGPRDGRRVLTAEAGHASLPIVDRDDWPLATALAGPEGRTTIEDALSARGIARVHAHLAPDAPPLDLSTLSSAWGQDAMVRRTAEYMLGLIGRVLGDLALFHLPLGGIVLTGGVVQALSPVAQSEAGAAQLRAGFARSETVAQGIATIPIYAVCDDFIALRGCAVHSQCA